MTTNITNSYFNVITAYAQRFYGNINMNSGNQIKLGAIISYISISINMLFGLVYTPWMIHSIDKENFGLYTLAMSVISLFVFDFGLSQAVQRFVAKYLAEGKKEQANNCLSIVAKLYLGIDIILLFLLTIVYFFIPSIYKELSLQEIDKFKIVYCIAAIFSILSFPFIPLNGILAANEKFVQLKSCELIHKFLTVGLMSICLILGYGLYALVTVNAISGLFTIILKLFVLKKNTNFQINWSYNEKNEFKSILSFSGWVTVIALAQRLIFNIAPTILGIFSGSASIATLGIAITLEGYVYLFASAINGLFLPKVARTMTAGENILPLMIKIGRIQITIIALIILGFVCVGKEFICNWVGLSFSDAYLGAILLIIPSLLHLPQEIADQALILTNRIKLKAKAFITMAILNIILSFILVPILGMIGMCISICISYLVRTIILDIIYQKELHIDVAYFFKESFIRMSFPLLLTLVIGWGINHIVPLNGWTGVFCKMSLFTLEYCIILYTLGMNKSEKYLFQEPLHHIYRKITNS